MTNVTSLLVYVYYNRMSVLKWLKIFFYDFTVERYSVFHTLINKL